MANGNFSEREYRTLNTHLIEGEEARAYAKQRRMSGALFYPTLAIATNKRIIIVNRWFMRLKSDITFIGYDNIASFRVVHGLMFSDIKIRLKGSSISAGYIFEGGREEGEIKGLHRDAAYAMVRAINMAIHGDYVETHNQRSMREEPRNNVQIGIYTNLGSGVTIEEKQLPMHSIVQGVSGSYELPQNYQVKPDDMLIFNKRHDSAGTYELPQNYEPRPDDLMIFKKRQMSLVSTGAKGNQARTPAVQDTFQRHL